MERITAIAAIIGALAWLPQIIKWISNYYKRPKITIVPDRELLVNFTVFGPYITTRLVISSEVLPVIIKDFKVTLTHESGDKHNLNWKTISQPSWSFRDYNAGANLQFEKSDPAIALKINQFDLDDVIIRFEDTEFTKNYNLKIKEFYKMIAFYKEKHEDYDKKILDSIEFKSLLDFYKPNFWFKKGNYTITFQLDTNIQSRLVTKKFKINLSQEIVDGLNKNFKLVENDFTNVIYTGVEDYKPLPNDWNSFYVKYDRK